MYEIASFVNGIGAAKSLGLHVVTNRRHVNGRPTDEWLVSFVGSVPADLAYAPGYTMEQVAKGRKYGGRFGPKTRSFGSVDEAWRAAEALGYTRCDCAGCRANAATREGR